MEQGCGNARHLITPDARARTASTIHRSTHLDDRHSVAYSLKHERESCQWSRWLEPKRNIAVAEKSAWWFGDGIASCEKTCAPYADVCQRVGLLGKPNGNGERPITLTECLYAIYMAGCKNEMRTWDSENHGWWDDADQSGLLRRVYEEVASQNGQSAVCMFFDMEKFYDSACLYKLVDRHSEKCPRTLPVRCNASLHQRADPSCWRHDGGKHPALK